MWRLRYQFHLLKSDVTARSIIEKYLISDIYYTLLHHPRLTKFHVLCHTFLPTSTNSEATLSPWKFNWIKLFAYRVFEIKDAPMRTVNLSDANIGAGVTHRIEMKRPNGWTGSPRAAFGDWSFLLVISKIGVCRLRHRVQEIGFHLVTINQTIFYAYTWGGDPKIPVIVKKNI
jgi:hypothetical protein